jgi:lipid II isoglutaminyl synthase (glutamine-hydrolysing)
MSKIASILLGKTIKHTTRILKIGGGSAAPGLYGLKLQPNLIELLIKDIPTNIIVTGTNGKTTTSRMIAHFFETQGFKTIRNSTGSNLERGIASSLLSFANPITGKIAGVDIGIWEVDEAAFNTLAAKLNPDVIVFLNVFRDQLDRYGEVDTVLKKWAQSIKSITDKTLLLVNGDDLNTAKLAQEYSGKTQTFGLKEFKIAGESKFLPKSKVKLDFEAKNIVQNGLLGSSFQIVDGLEPMKIDLPIPGLYHIYDFLAAYSVCYNLNLDPKKMIESLKDFSPAFGRVEKISLPSDKKGYIFLIKNPVGATQVFETIAPELTKDDHLLLALNDNFADGTDVSWIWDAQFEKLKVKEAKLKVICSGIRAYDLAVRLKYAGFTDTQLIVEPNLHHAFTKIQESLKGNLFVLPTYTALLELQKILTQTGIKSAYWKEEK